MSNWTVIQKKSHGGQHGYYSKYYGQPVVIVTPPGEILITPFCIEMMGGSEITHVNILYDPKDRKFGFQPTTFDASPMSAHKVQYVRTVHHGKRDAELKMKDTHKNEMARVAAQSFTREAGLIVEEHCTIFQADIEQDMLIVSMSQRREVIPYLHRASGPRKSKNGQHKA